MLKEYLEKLSDSRGFLGILRQLAQESFGIYEKSSENHLESLEILSKNFRIFGILRDSLSIGTRILIEFSRISKNLSRNHRHLGVLRDSKSNSQTENNHGPPDVELNREEYQLESLK